MSFRNLTPIATAAISFAQAGTDLATAPVGNQTDNVGIVYSHTEFRAGGSTADDIISTAGNYIIKHFPDVEYWVSIQNMSTAGSALRNLGAQARWYNNHDEVASLPLSHIAYGGYSFKKVSDNFSISGRFYPQNTGSLGDYLDIYANDIIYGRYDSVAVENGGLGETTTIVLTRGV